MNLCTTIIIIIIINNNSISIKQKLQSMKTIIHKYQRKQRKHSIKTFLGYYNMRTTQ